MSDDDLRLVALVNYGHFTAMQVRNGAVRGLGLHLERLDRSTRELFGTGLDPERVLAAIRPAAGAPVSLRINVFARDRDGISGGAPVQADLVVTTGPPAEPAVAPLRVQSVRHERFLPHVKHVGTFASTCLGRRARQRGFDDALFVDAGGRISEGTIWNVCFFDGERVVWPSAPALPGIAMQLLRRGLGWRGISWETREVRLDDLRSLGAAFATNSISAAQPIAAVDDVALPVDAELTALLIDCYEANPWEPVAQS